MERPFCCFVLLNPSLADESNDDPTVRRCIDFGRKWGYGGLAIVNLFAFVCSDPRKLLEVKDPLGPSNDEYILKLHTDSGITVTGWGDGGKLLHRHYNVMRMLRAVKKPAYLKKTKMGYPQHPLFVKGSVLPRFDYYPGDTNDPASNPVH